jgi:hypothetical protein
MRGKRGAESELAINPIFIFLILLAVLFVGLGEKIHHIGDSDNVIAAFYARDIAMLSDASGGALNDISIPYAPNPYPLRNFTVQLTNKSVVVTKKDAEQEYVLRNPLGLRIDEENQSISVIVTKTGDTLSISAKRLNKLQCPESVPQARGFDKAVLDPGHGSIADQGEIIDGKSEAELMRQIALSASNSVSGGLASPRSPTDDGPEPLEAGKRATQMTGFRYGISIHAGEGKITKAYISGDPLPSSHSATALERERLACLMVNVLSEEPEIEGIAVIPIDLNSLAEDDPRRVLSATDVGVYLELGEPNYKPESGAALKKGLEAFFHG